MGYFIFAGGRLRRVYFEKDGIRVDGWRKPGRLLTTVRRCGTMCLVPDDTDPSLFLVGPELEKKRKSKSQKESLNPKSASFVQKTIMESESESEAGVKELIISEEVVKILRRFLKKNNTKVDLHRFDTDDAYKKLVFYRISPLVRLERCPAIANILAKKKFKASDNRKQATTWNHMTSSSEDSDSSKNNKLKKTYSPPPQKDAMVFLPNDFRSPVNRTKTSLESRQNRQREPSTSSSTEEKENKESAKVGPTRSTTTTKRKPLHTTDKTNDQKEEASTKVTRRPVVVPRRSSVAPGREYSSFEDHTIIAWLDKDQGRQRAVSGNVVWRLLENEYYSMTQIHRSWHSLRNRYLRYIIPSIWQLGLPAQQVYRFVANYGTGDLRQKKKIRNRDKRTSNSLLVLPTVKSAYSRRPKSPDAWTPSKKVEESLPLKSAKPLLRSSSVGAVGASGHARDNSGEPSPRSTVRRRERGDNSSPFTYSEIIKRFRTRRSTPNSGSSACSSVQPLDDYDGPRAPLRRQVSLDEERRDDCQGHWRGHYVQGEEEQRGVRLFRAMLLHHLRLHELRPPPCIVAPATFDHRGWWLYWRDWRSLARAAKRFRETKAQARLAEKAHEINLLGLDEMEFEDIMQELCQACCHTEQRALVVLAFLCEVCARAVRVGGACRATDWAAKHVATCATPWAIRHGGWSTVVERAGGGTRREDSTLLAGAALAALIAFILFYRVRLRNSV